MGGGGEVVALARVGLVAFAERARENVEVGGHGVLVIDIESINYCGPKWSQANVDTACRPE